MSVINTNHEMLGCLTECFPEYSIRMKQYDIIFTPKQDSKQGVVWNITGRVTYFDDVTRDPKVIQEGSEKSKWLEKPCTIDSFVRWVVTEVKPVLESKVPAEVSFEQPRRVKPVLESKVPAEVSFEQPRRVKPDLESKVPTEVSFEIPRRVKPDLESKAPTEVSFEIPRRVKPDLESKAPTEITFKIIASRLLRLAVDLSDVEAKWHAPEGSYSKSADKIARMLFKHSKDRKQAMSRLCFYINRAGSNLTKADKARLEDAKLKLQNLYEN